MSKAKLYRKQDQDFRFEGKNPEAHRAFVNVGNSDTMGGGMSVIGAGCNYEWTVTDDEILFVYEGKLELKVGSKIFSAGPGDTLWIPRNTTVTYHAEEDVWFFFAVFPATNSPAAGKVQSYPDSPPQLCG